MHKVSRKPSEGIYYVVLLPEEGWTLLTHRFDVGGDNDHSTWWETTLAGVVAAKWAAVLGRSPQVLRREIVLHPYGFPRGRVSLAYGEETFLVLHGADLKRSMCVTKRMIEDAFGIVRACSWEFDEHEQCQDEDQNVVLRCLEPKGG